MVAGCSLMPCVLDLATFFHAFAVNLCCLFLLFAENKSLLSLLSLACHGYKLVGVGLCRLLLPSFNFYLFYVP